VVHQNLDGAVNQRAGALDCFFPSGLKPRLILPYQLPFSPSMTAIVSIDNLSIPSAPQLPSWPKRHVWTQEKNNKK
jgi:hypothetical protein